MKKKLTTLLITLSLLICFSTNTLAVGLHNILFLDFGVLCSNHTYKCPKCSSTSFSNVKYYHHHYLTMPFLGVTQYTDWDYPEYKCAKCGTLWNGKFYQHGGTKYSKTC
jgi:DNA-directed RNA polymerase subunit RPC12/RpoP